MLGLLLLIGLLGCQKNEASVLPASDLLYRSWQLAKADIDGTDVTNQYTRIATFQRNGTFGNGQRSSSCCAPVSFEGDDSTLRFIWDTSDPQCALINCKLSPLFGDITWQISALTSDKLVLISEKITLVYEPAP
ncbi:hypothetical protein GCM10027341_01480 [Spirosoma knui]